MSLGRANGVAPEAAAHTIAARAEAHPALINSVIALAAGEVVPVAGGVLVRDHNDDVIGAVGVSGHLADGDEACALRGIAAAGLRADPGA